MKKFVCSKVRFIEAKNVVSIINGIADLEDGKSWFSVNFTSATITEDLSTSFTGKLITQTLHVNGELTPEIANRLMNTLIFELTLSDGRTMLWGDKVFRCRVKSESLTIGQGVISFERKTRAFQF